MRVTILLILLFLFNQVFTQSIPASDENIPFMVTFSEESNKSWGDPDHLQILFFVIPENYNLPVFIRVFDPDCGGVNDENRGGFNSTTKFSV
ncbi:MAG: hypothetical protein AB7O73_04895 [Bacteroidia bacterium]